MYQSITPNGTRTITITKETLSGLQLHLNANDAGLDPVELISPQKSNLKVTLQREGYRSETIFSGTLFQAIVFYVANGRHHLSCEDLDIKQIRTVPIDFMGSIDLKGDDKIIIEVTINTSSFDSMIIASSSFSIHSVDSYGDTGSFMAVERFSFGAGSTKKDFKEIPSNTVKIVCSSDTFASIATDAHPIDVTLESSTFDTRLLKEQIDYNQTLFLGWAKSTRHFILYSGSALNEVSLEVELSKSASDLSSILCGYIKRSK